jgi:hypothetical protein
LEVSGIDEGKTYGELPDVKKPKQPRKYKPGLMRYYKPFLIDVKIGDVAVIPLMTLLKNFSSRRNYRLFV